MDILEYICSRGVCGRSGSFSISSVDDGVESLLSSPSLFSFVSSFSVVGSSPGLESLSVSVGAGSGSFTVDDGTVCDGFRLCFSVIPSTSNESFDPPLKIRNTNTTKMAKTISVETRFIKLELVDVRLGVLLRTLLLSIPFT